MRFIAFIFLLVVSAFSKELININLKNLDLMQLVNITSSELNLNILVTKKLEGKVNFISKKAVSKQKLLELLKLSLHDNGYKLERRGSFYRVIKKTPSKTIKKYVNKKEKLTRIIPLLYSEANEIEIVLNNIISKRMYKASNKPSISFQKTNNSIIIDGNTKEVQNLVNIIKNLDHVKTQVFVKANILEVDNNLIEEIGIKYGILGAKIRSGDIYTFSSSLNSGKALSFDISDIGLDIPNVSSSLALGASLNLLSRTYALDIISQPSILCLDNSLSSIYVGETVSIQTASTTTDGGSTKNSFNREDIGLSLKVKPRVSKDNKVLLHIDTILENIKAINSLSLNPDTSKKQITTKALVNNGESVIIGGLMQTRKENTLEKVPFASDIPLLGELFKNRLNNNQNKNLVVIVTPYIVPKHKDLTYVRQELSKLKNLENRFLEEVLIKLKSKKIKQKEIKKKQRTLHEKRVKSLLGA